VPVSAQLKYNIDAVNEYIVKRVPIPIRDFASSPRLIVIRSFDVNKPGAEVADLKGGVAGGSILTGVLKLGQQIEVRPGLIEKDQDGKVHCRPLFSTVATLFAEHNDLQFAVPGGLIGVGTKIDPTLCRGDRLVGQVLGAVGELPAIYVELEIQYFLLRRLLGVKTDDKKQTKVQKLAKNEVLMVNIGSTSTGGRVMSVKADLAKILLTAPACTEVGEKIALSRRIVSGRVEPGAAQWADGDTSAGQALASRGMGHCARVSAAAASELRAKLTMTTQGHDHRGRDLVGAAAWKEDGSGHLEGHVARASARAQRAQNDAISTHSGGRGRAARDGD
jgi:hypothetical protein